MADGLVSTLEAAGQDVPQEIQEILLLLIDKNNVLQLKEKTFRTLYEGMKDKGYDAVLEDDFDTDKTKASHVAFLLAHAVGIAKGWVEGKPADANHAIQEAETYAEYKLKDKEIKNGEDAVDLEEITYLVDQSVKAVLQLQSEERREYLKEKPIESRTR